MDLLLDTETLGFSSRGRPEVRKRVVDTPIGDLATSSICIGELHYGAAKSRNRDARTRAVWELQRSLLVYEFGEREAVTFGRLKSGSEARGSRLADADLMIAATALERDLVVVTDNLRHFERVPNLRFETWVDRG